MLISRSSARPAQRSYLPEPLPGTLRLYARSPGLCVCAGRLLAGCALTCSAARLLRRPPARCAFLPRWPSPLRRAPARTGPRGAGPQRDSNTHRQRGPGKGLLTQQPGFSPAVTLS